MQTARITRRKVHVLIRDRRVSVLSKGGTEAEKQGVCSFVSDTGGMGVLGCVCNTGSYVSALRRYLGITAFELRTFFLR